MAKASDVEADRDDDPDRVGLVELAQRVAQADQLREEEVDADQQQRRPRPPVWISRRRVKIGSSSGIAAVRRDPLETPTGSYPLARRSKRRRPPVTAWTAGSASGSPRAHGGDQAGAGEQVGDVVLAQVDEREAERQRVGPAHGALDRARFGERDRRHRRGGEVQRRHRRPGVAAQRRVHLRPGRAPGLLADAEHDPPHRLRRSGPAPRPTTAARSARRSSRRSRSRRPRPSGGRRAGSARGGGEDPDQGQVGLEEPDPVDPGEDAVERADSAQARERPLQADVGQAAEADHAVERRSGSGAQPRLAALRDRRREARGPW